MASLSLHAVHKKFGDLTVLHGIDLDVQDGEFVVFVGPSGCGKSTLLRCIAGLEDISAGTLTIDGQTMNDVDPAKRGLAMVFQSYALFPHMTVADNLSFGMRLARVAPLDITQRVNAVAEVLQLGPLLQRLPAQLSGGQRQRVAIGRAIVREPKVFLFDEPLSNLDASLRVQMRMELARLHARLKATMLYVTHDQAEAMTLADRIVVFNQGRIEQVGAPMTLYRQPANVFVAGFLGSPRINLLPADCLGAAAPSGCAQVGVRPEHLQLQAADEPAAPDAPHVSAVVHLVEPLGDVVHVHAQSATVPGMLTASVHADHSVRNGDAVRLSFSPRHALCFDSAGTRMDVNL